MEILITRCDIRHLEAATTLFSLYRRFYRMPEDNEGVRLFLSDRLRRADSIFLLATDAREQWLGFTQLYPMFSSTRMVRLWVLNDLFVVPAARRRGVGRRLMEAARDYAIRGGVKVLTLATEKQNAAAKQLYEAVGYELDTAFDHYELTL